MSAAGSTSDAVTSAPWAAATSAGNPRPEPTSSTRSPLDVARRDRLGQRSSGRPQLGPVRRLLDGGLEQHGEIARLGPGELDDDVAAANGLEHHVGIMRGGHGHAAPTPWST